MRTYYLDSNALFQLAREPDVANAALDMQRARRFRLAVGYRTVWEMAGVLEHKPSDAGNLRHEAGLALAIIDSGGVLARDGLILSIDALSLSPFKRHPYRVSATIARAENLFHKGRDRLHAMATGRAEGATLAWYKRVASFFDPRAFAAAQRRYETLIRKDQRRELATTSDLLHDLNGLQAFGKLREIAEVTSLQVARMYERVFKGGRSIPSNAPLAWFGPLGVLVRCQMAFTLLHVLKHDPLGKKRPSPSDLSDISHITVAGMLGSLVTNDGAAKVAFHLTWPSNSRTCPVYSADFLPMLVSQHAT